MSLILIFFVRLRKYEIVYVWECLWAYVVVVVVVVIVKTSLHLTLPGEFNVGLYRALCGA